MYAKSRWFFLETSFRHIRDEIPDIPQYRSPLDSFRPSKKARQGNGLPDNGSCLCSTALNPNNFVRRKLA